MMDNTARDVGMAPGAAAVRIWIGPIAVFLAVLLATMGMWHSQQVHEQERMRREVRLAAEVLAASLRAIMDAQVKALARMAGYSTYHFLRLFKKHTGHTVHAYIDQCRQKRMEQLERKGTPRAQIAHALGFTALSSFSRWRRQRGKRR